MDVLKERANISKKEIYNASLNLKKYFWYWFYINKMIWYQYHLQM
jgi:hypothetical protein